MTQPTFEMTAAEAKASAWGRDQNRGEYKPSGHVVLTTHPRRGSPITVTWGAGMACDCSDFHLLHPLLHLPYHSRLLHNFSMRKNH